MQLQAVIFDLDNTLIDFMEMKKKSCEAAIEAMRDNGLDMDKEKALDVLYSLYDEHGWEHQRIFQLFLKEVLGDIDYKIMAAGIVAYRRIKRGHLYHYPQVPEILDQLREQGYKLAILTDAPRIQAWTRLCALELQHKFDHVSAFEDMEDGKTNQKPFLNALQQLELDNRPERALMVGDSLQRDILPAKQAGLKTALAKYGMSQRRDQPSQEDYEKAKKDNKIDFELEQFSQVLNII